MPRPRGRPALWPALGVGLIWAFLALFLVYPLTPHLLRRGHRRGGTAHAGQLPRFFTDRFYLRSLVELAGPRAWRPWSPPRCSASRSPSCSCATISAGAGLFSYLTLIPIISPPLVGVLGFTFILGRAGTVNVLLMDAFDMLKPINFLYGIHGVVLVETLHLFPMITLNVVDALGKIDPSLEEAAESVGARGWRKLWTVTLPLTTPGLRRGRAARLHLDLLRLRHAARPGRPGPARRRRPTSTSCSSWTGASSAWAS